MERYEFSYQESDFGKISFDAKDFSEAEYLFAQVRDGEIEYDELPNYSRKTMGGMKNVDKLTIVKPPLPSIPILLKTGENK